MPTTPEDKSLISAAQGGDDGAFAEIFRRYHPYALSCAISFIQNRTEAEDVAQHAMIRFHRTLPRYEGRCSLKSWIYGIVHNLSRNQYWHGRRRMRHLMLSLDEPVVPNADFGPRAELVDSESADPAELCERTDQERRIDEGMFLLEPHHREILTLRNTLSQPYEEIAANLGINVGTVKSRIARARRNLRKLAA